MPSRPTCSLYGRSLATPCPCCADITMMTRSTGMSVAARRHLSCNPVLLTNTAGYDSAMRLLIAMRRLIALFTLLFLHTVCPLGPAGAAPPVRGYAVAEEVIVPGEAPDLARVTAYTRARLKLIQQLAEIVHDQTPSPALSGEDLEAAIADHVTVRILREVQREEMESMHVTVEIEGTVEPRAWRT